MAQVSSFSKNSSHKFSLFRYESISNLPWGCHYSWVVRVCCFPCNIFLLPINSQNFLFFPLVKCQTWKSIIQRRRSSVRMAQVTFADISYSQKQRGKSQLQILIQYFLIQESDLTWKSTIQDLYISSTLQLYYYHNYTIVVISLYSCTIL